MLAVHDEIVIGGDEGEALTAQEWLVGCLLRGMSAFLKLVSVQVEAAVGQDWSMRDGGEGLCHGERDWHSAMGNGLAVVTKAS